MISVIYESDATTILTCLLVALCSFFNRTSNSLRLSNDDKIELSIVTYTLFLLVYIHIFYFKCCQNCKNNIYVYILHRYTLFRSKFIYISVLFIYLLYINLYIFINIHLRNMCEYLSHITISSFANYLSKSEFLLYLSRINNLKL